MFFTETDRCQIADAILRAKEDVKQEILTKVSSNNNWSEFLGSAYSEAHKELVELREEVKKLNHQLELLVKVIHVAPIQNKK